MQSRLLVLGLFAAFTLGVGGAPAQALIRPAHVSAELTGAGAVPLAGGPVAAGPNGQTPADGGDPDGIGLEKPPQPAGHSPTAPDARPGRAPLIAPATNWALEWAWIVRLALTLTW